MFNRNCAIPNVQKVTEEQSSPAFHPFILSVSSYILCKWKGGGVRLLKAIVSLVATLRHNPVVRLLLRRARSISHYRSTATVNGKMNALCDK